MKVLLYEFVTGGGWWSIDAGDPPSGSLLAEGSLMLESLARDFLAIDHLELIFFRDARLADCDLPGHCVTIHSAMEEQSALAAWSAKVDWTVLIAPEFDRHLQSRSEWLQLAGGRQLSPDSAFIALTGNKLALNQYLRERDVQVPTACLWNTAEPLPTAVEFPVICKPRFGAGSLGITTLHAGDPLTGRTADEELYVERFVAGTAASVAVISGPNQQLILPAAHQRLSEDGRFTYLGGHLPMAAPLAERSRRIVERVFDCLPHTVGYVGCDLVLGDAPSGAEDWLIEINPRVTTSYIGLRKICRENLAAAMISIAEGRPTELSFRSEAVEFEV